VKRSTFRSLKYRFTVKHRLPFIYQAEVLCFDRKAIQLTEEKITNNKLRREEAGKLFFTHDHYLYTDKENK
jgi:hypothetical protein